MLDKKEFFFREFLPGIESISFEDINELDSGFKEMEENEEEIGMLNERGRKIYFFSLELQSQLEDKIISSIEKNNEDEEMKELTEKIEEVEKLYSFELDRSLKKTPYSLSKIEYDFRRGWKLIKVRNLDPDPYKEILINDISNN